MKTCTIFALLLTLPTPAFSLEGSLAVREELVELIRLEQQLCERGAITSGILDRENHLPEKEIQNHIFQLLVACDTLTAHREERLAKGVLSAVSLPPERDGRIDLAKALAILDRHD